jgi:hypothetical protein
MIVCPPPPCGIAMPPPIIMPPKSIPPPMVPERIEAKVTLRYGDERRNEAGKLLEQTPEGERQNTYVFGRNQKSWKLERVIFQAS